MRLVVDQKIFEKFPGIRLGVVVALGVDNTGKSEFLDLLRNEELSIRKRLKNVEISKHELILPWREIYRQFGSKPSEYNSSVEALIKRVVKGKELSDINSLVNLYNALSLKYVMPFGGEDLDKISGDIRLTFATGDETGVYLGSDEIDACDNGEVAYLDNLGFICRRWNWRESKRAMLTNDTKNVVLVTEALPNISDEVLHSATQDLASCIKSQLGGQLKVVYLDSSNCIYEDDFQTGRLLKEGDKKKIAARVKISSYDVKNIDRRIDKNDGQPVGVTAKIIYESIKNLNLGVDNFTVEHPADETKGDYSSNIAMVMGGNPRENAEKIIEELKNDKELREVVDLERIEVAGPGFINFFLNDKYISSKLEIDKDFGKSDWMKGKKVLVEYSSPNIAKRFSVGHFRSTLIGQALFNLYKNSGAEVTNDNHLGDWGTQFGMIIAAVKEWDFDWCCEDPIGKLEDLYVRFNKEMAEKPELRDKARDEFLKLEKGDRETREIWQKSVDVSMKEFSQIYQKLDISFEHQNGESIYELMMPAIIEECKVKKVCVEGEGGALIVPFEKDGKEYYPPAMLRKSDGTTTYFTRDLATIRKRLDDDDLKSDLYIYEVGSEQTMHFRQVFEAVEKLGWASKNIFKHVQHGLLTLPEGKMSTRKGNTIKLDDLLGRAEEKSPELAIASVKYNELKRSPVMNYVFNWEEALSMEGNSAPYINYAYVRANKILEGKEILDGKFVFEGEEKDLARFILRFALGEEVEKAASGYAPQSMCTYVYEVAKRFNGFYERNKVLGDPREKQRLMIVLMVREVIKRGLETLGIKVVESM